MISFRYFDVVDFYSFISLWSSEWHITFRFLLWQRYGGWEPLFMLETHTSCLTRSGKQRCKKSTLTNRKQTHPVTNHCISTVNPPTHSPVTDNGFRFNCSWNWGAEEYIGMFSIIRMALLCLMVYGWCCFYRPRLGQHVIYKRKLNHISARSYA